jgi:alanine racemase
VGHVSDGLVARLDPDAPQATIDLGAIVANVGLLRSFAPGARLLAAIKADAYGHGLLPVARALADAGVDAFGVATAAEALALRTAGIGGLVLLFGPVGDGIADLIAADVALTVTDRAALRAIEAAGASGRARVHVKVDTGMGRLGLPPAAATALIAAVDRSRATDLEGVWTHLASADEAGADAAGSATDLALRSFGDLLAALARDGLRPPWAHAANSAALVVRPDAGLDMVRPGIALYGQPPSAWVAPRVPQLRPALRLDAPVTFVKRVPSATPISYGGTWVAPHATVVATVRLGYADGYPRALSSRGSAAHRGVRVPLVGRVCMDQVMVDLGPDGEAAFGERIEFVGGAAPSAVEVAERAGSFVYELLTGIGPRVARRYVSR